MTKKLVHIEFYDPIYHIRYYVCVGDLAKYEKFSGDTCVKGGRCYTKIVGDNIYVYIYLGRFNIPTLCHECCHAANAVFTEIGSPIDRSTDEGFAYYVQWLVGTIMVSFKKEIDV